MRSKMITIFCAWSEPSGWNNGHSLPSVCDQHIDVAKLVKWAGVSVQIFFKNPFACPAKPISVPSAADNPAVCLFSVPQVGYSIHSLSPTTCPLHQAHYFQIYIMFSTSIICVLFFFLPALLNIWRWTQVLKIKRVMDLTLNFRRAGHYHKI